MSTLAFETQNHKAEFDVATEAKVAAQKLVSPPHQPNRVMDKKRRRCA